eukprot:CAMPEP_0113543662 /NCGR_PEP_ID=MMETSP0015_2-20120614/10278_1 /TAXON_ID=2838 /ORGANISM="Odontella" /LENGTH=386 /DNA_ID=CAMNT_0000443837 /DNA_START=96 /DNA_END=1256 /DNA_ORIENTATION=+ /assembly_acc=CAM_ASM_000160
MTAVPLGSGASAPSKMESQSSFSSSISNTSAVDSATALHTLLSPDGYYKYLRIPKPPPPAGAGSTFMPGKQGDDADGGANSGGQQSIGEVDADIVKKNYRRLSLRHHPDRPSGDAETFRVLNRAKRVLTNPKLRRQYDLLGLDLDEEEGEGGNDGGDGEKKEAGNGDGAADGQEEAGSGGSDGGVLSQMASATLAVILQMAVRTVMMGLASTLVCRYKLLLIPSIIFLAFITYKVTSTIKQLPAGTISMRERASPSMIALGLVLMYFGRSDEHPWSWTFWLGEALVMTMLLGNSVPTKSPALDLGFVILSLILSLILRGKFWRYVMVLCFTGALGIIALLVFPVMEMVLEEIMNEKLRKIGEKVRAHAKMMERYNSSSSGTAVVSD